VVSQLEVVVDCGEACGLVGVYRDVCRLYVPVCPAGVVVRCGGLMLRRVRHGRGGDEL
jgi:hypothetical protein